MKITNSLLFNISGGLGKNIAAIAVVKALKKKYPSKDIIVSSAHSDAWTNNKDIKNFISISTPQEEEAFRKESLENSDNTIFRLEPYSSEDYFYRRKSLPEIWCDVYDIPYKGEMPSLTIEEAEIQSVKKKASIGSSDKIFLIQTSGGAPQQPYPVSWARDLPFVIAEEVCLKMKEAGYRVIHLRRKDQRELKNAEWFDLTMKEVFALISISEKRLFIDSFAQHAAAALNRPSVVTWVANSPKVFGYTMHTNILPSIEPEFRHTIDSFLEPYNILGALHECPFNTDRIYSVDSIIEALDTLSN